MKSAPSIATLALAAAGLTLSACSRQTALSGQTALAGSAETKPVVAVATVTRQDLAQTLTTQAEFRPYQEVELHAKVSGYLSQILVDFGDKVKEGQLLAVIEVPELADELAAARAAEKRAEADYVDAHLEYVRLMGVSRTNPNLVAQQDIDAVTAKERMAQANVVAAKADVGKYETLVSYTRITAPFAGVITGRYVDPGALIEAGTSSANTQPIVRLSENSLLRLDFPVSVTYAETIHVGDPVDIRLLGSGRHLTANVTRFTRRISLDTRTMITEVEVPNPDLKLIPGMYVTVRFDIARRPNAVAVPVTAVNPGPSPTVMVVGADGRIAVREVTLGIETPNHYEVLSGLAPGEQVIVGNRDIVHAGEAVVPKLAEYASLP